MKRVRTIIAAAVALYLLAMGIAWVVATDLAHRRTVDSLLDAKQVLAQLTDDTVDSILWYASRKIAKELGDTLQPCAIERLQSLAESYGMDEINVVDDNGLVIASNIKSIIGFDFRSHPLTAEFLDVLTASIDRATISQPYRDSVGSDRRYAKYYGVAFSDRSGLIQVGVSLKRVCRSFDNTPTDNYPLMRIGRYGHFEAVDFNYDGFVDHDDKTAVDIPEFEQIVETTDDDGESAFSYMFSYVGLLFRAVIPKREFYEQRNVMLTIGGIALTVIVVLLTWFMVKLSISSEKLEAMHRAAAERTASDLSVARVIQLSSLPRAELFRPTRLDCGFEAVTYPAREVGGDFYSLFELSDGRIVFLVADVSGKGVPAAMFMHVASNVIKNGFYIEDSAEAVMEKVNDYLCEHNQAEMFVSAWVGVLNPKTGAVEYVNAGHNRPYLLHRDGRVEMISGKGGLLLGMYAGCKYKACQLQLEAGDRLFLYTDGVVEAMDASRHTYGAARLVQLLEREPDDLCDAVRDDVQAYVRGAEQSDDLTMLVLSWFGDRAGTERAFTGNADALGPAMAFLREQIGLKRPQAVSRLLNAADEMISNVVNYARCREFRLCVRNIPGRCQVVLTDDGTEYNPLLHTDPDRNLPLQQRPEGGLGIVIAKKLVDFIHYRREAGCNVLTIVQRDAHGEYRQFS